MRRSSSTVAEGQSLPLADVGITSLRDAQQGGGVMADPAIIRARGVVLTDGHGRDRAKLWLDPDFDETPRLDLFDAAGRRRLRLCLSSCDGAPWIELRNAQGGAFLYIGETDAADGSGAGMIGFDVDDSTLVPDRTMLESGSGTAAARAAAEARDIARAGVGGPDLAGPDDALAQAALESRARAARTARRRAARARRRTMKGGA